MRSFGALLKSLDDAGTEAEQIECVANYLRQTPPEDAAWAVYFLQGHRLQRSITLSQLREWVQEFTQLPAWLIEECQSAVGDSLETLTLLLPAGTSLDAPPRLSDFVRRVCLPMRGLPLTDQKQQITTLWNSLVAPERSVANTLLVGRELRSLPPRPLIRALSTLAQINTPILAQRLADYSSPQPESFAALLAAPSDLERALCPLPFHPVASESDPLRTAPTAEHCLVEWNWKGVRAQLIRRGNACALWSDDEDLISAALPELTAAARALPEGTVLDGVVCARTKEHTLPTPGWQKLLSSPGRPNRSASSLTYRFMAHDCLECAGEDLRPLPLQERRERLTELLREATTAAATPTRQSASPQWTQGDLFAPATTALPPPSPAAREPAIQLSPALPFHTPESLSELRKTSRREGAQGLMLKRLQAPYGDPAAPAWTSWTLPPLTCLAVLRGIQPGAIAQGRARSFWHMAVRQGLGWVQIATVVPELPAEEMEVIDAFIQKNIVARFGPSRHVKPELVFEIAFDGLHPSARHKAGLVLETPRLVCWHRDKSPDEAHSVESLARSSA